MLLMWLIWAIQKNAKNLKILKSLHMATHLRVLSKIYPMNTNMVGFKWFSKIFLIWTKVASALGGLIIYSL